MNANQIILVLSFLLFSSSYISAQQQKSIPEEDRYDTFSAIYDETGWKMDDVQTVQSTIHFIEAWTVTKAWETLSDKEQQAYLSGLTAPIELMLDNGVEIISWDVNNVNTDQRADYDFFAIWSFPSQESVKVFEEAIAASGWYTYFEQVNISGLASSPQTVMKHLIGSH